ncbi:hypothetical protein ACFL1D_02445 [Candidatus Omnitrophota bacterium]
MKAKFLAILMIFLFAGTCSADPDTFRFGTAGEGAPGGDDTQVQFNDGGSFGGDEDLVWIKGTGRLGIGTTDPDYKLVVDSSGGGDGIKLKGTAWLYAESCNFNQYVDSGYGFRFRKSDQTEYMRIADGGNVGIGTTDPSFKLNVVTSSMTAIVGESSGSYGVAGIGSTGSTGGLYGEAYGTGSAVYAYSESGIGVNATSNGDSGDMAVAAYGDAATALYGSSNGWGLYVANGDAYFDENVGIGTTDPDALLQISGPTGTNGLHIRAGEDSPDYLLHIEDQDGTAQAMYIDSTGYVGIGTTNCVNRLTIGANADAYNNNDLVVSNSLGSFAIHNVTADETYLYGNGNIHLRPAGIAAGLFAEVGGDVGIGTTNPTYQLHVDGDFAGSPNTVLVQMGGTGASTGNTLRVIRDRSSGNTDSPVVDIINDHDTDDQVLLRLQQDASADIVNIFNDGAEVFTILDGGNVGIGTTDPASKLEIAGTSSTISNSTGDLTITPAGDLIISSGNVGIGLTNPTATLHVNGNIKAKMQNDVSGSNTQWNSSTPGTVCELGYDVAELFEANEEVEIGDVLVIDENGKLKKSAKSYDTKVAGIVSGAPAILFEGSQLQIAPQPFEFTNGIKPPLALAGRVYVKATTVNGLIKPGDLLTTSDKEGYAMLAKEHKPGTILGKALENLDEEEGKILVLVTLQ